MRTDPKQLVPGTEGQVIKVISGKAAWGTDIGGGGASLQFVWDFDTGTADADPGSGKFRFNNGTQASATFIFINDETENGVNVRNVLLQLDDGDRVYLQKEDDNTVHHLVEVTGPAEGASGYVKVPITVTDSGTDLGSGDKTVVLVLTNAQHLKLYDAVVAPSGGDYTTVGAAVTAGHKRIFVRAGTYAETADINLPEEGCLIGESPGPVILDFGAGAFSLRVDGTARSSSAGTFSVAQGATAVVGVGTTFQTDLLAGDWLKLGGIWHEIATITDELNMTLTLSHEGAAISGLAVKAQSMFMDVCIQGITVQNSTAQGIEILNANRLKMVGVAVELCGSVSLAGVEFTDTVQALITGLDVRNSTSQGILMLRCDNCRINKSTIHDSDGVGFHLTDCLAVTASEVYTQHNNAEGTLVDGTSSKCTFANCISARNTAEGFETSGTTGSTVFDGCTSSLNTGAGIDLDGTENTADSCIVNDNGANGFLGGASCLISNCHVETNGAVGIDVSDDENSSVIGNKVLSNVGNGINVGDVNITVTGNSSRLNGGDGIELAAGATNCVVAANVFQGNTGVGLEILAGATGNVVHSNILAGNTADSITDAGTGTQLAHVQRDIDADQFQIPNNADWAVNSPAPIVADATNAGITVALLDDTTEMGVGLEQQIPYVVTKLKLTTWSRCASAPTAPALNFGHQVYIREIAGDSTAVGAWSAANALTTIVFPAGATGAFFLKTTEVLDLSTLGLTPGLKYQFQFTRNTVVANDVVGDIPLKGYTLEFY